MKRDKVTFNEIAHYTGFSKTTISRYFNDPDSVSEKTREQLSVALKKLNYRENKLARVLAKGKTEFIGVIIPDLQMHYYARLLTEILAMSDLYGYKFLVFQGRGNLEAEERYIRELLSYSVEGLLMVSHTIPSASLASLDIPVITIEREDRHVSSVNADNYCGGRLAAKALADCGCEIMIHINADLKPVSPAYGRIIGFRNLCAELKLPEEEFLHSFGNKYEEIYPVMKTVFDTIRKKYKDRKKGIFVSNDTAANVLLNIILQTYRTLPGDWKIVGFDDSPISQEAVIPISSIRQDIPRIATEAVKMLADQIEEKKKGKHDTSLYHNIIPVEYIGRRTTQ